MVMVASLNGPLLTMPDTVDVGVGGVDVGVGGVDVGVGGVEAGVGGVEVSAGVELVELLPPPPQP